MQAMAIEDRHNEIINRKPLLTPHTSYWGKPEAWQTKALGMFDAQRSGYPLTTECKGDARQYKFRG